MASKHTPGPWSWWTSNSWRCLSAVGDGDVLCPMVSVSDGHPDLLVSEANARLIAAAPELLDTLEAWVELVERTIKTQYLFLKLEANSVADFTQALNETRAEIAKAKGEA